MATPLPELQRGDGVITSKSSKRVDCARTGEEDQKSSPILIFLYFHKAIRNELDSLHQLALAFATGSRVDDVKPLFDRYRFLRVVYKHHSNAEDEVS